MHHHDITKKYFEFFRCMNNNILLKHTPTKDFNNSKKYQCAISNHYHIMKQKNIHIMKCTD